MSENEDQSFGERETLRGGGAGAVSEGEKSFGDRETLRSGEGWGILEEWGGKRWKAGEEILGRYVVEGELGQGGMGVVYACLDKVGGVRVAVKALPPELSHNSVEMEEVRENFELVVGLRHPNIAGVRTLEKDGKGEYFLVMDVAEGESLRKWMRKRWKEGGIPLEEAVGVLRQVASALDYAHGEKVVHRDVKPGNVVIDGRGRVKVLDFGLAAQIRTSMSRASQAYRGTSGTGPYMAPEQWRAEPQDAKTDQYALAVMAYEMLAGRLPFENGEIAVLREAVLREEPKAVPGLSKVTMAALRRGMAKEAGERFGSCGEFVEALGKGKKKRGESRFANSERKEGKNRWLKWVPVLLLAVVVCKILWWWWNEQPMPLGGTQGSGTAAATMAIHAERGKIFDCNKKVLVVNKPVKTEWPISTNHLVGMGNLKDCKRAYPEGTLGCHVLGFVNGDGVGMAGVELACDYLLAARDGAVFGQRDIDVEAGDGADVYLSLDREVQYFAEKALAAAVEEYEAQAGWVIVEEVRTGAILGMASWPTYDPAKVNTAEEGARKNRAVGFNYEPGSIFTVGVVAAALDAGIISTNDLFDCEMGHWTYKGKRLNDFHPYGVLDVAGILAKSSNVGSAKIAVMLGEERLHRYLEAYGFGRKTGVGLPDEETGILYSLENWRKYGIDITRIAIGHSVSVTALQMVNFLCCIGNDGYLMKPFLVRKVVDRNGEVLKEREPEVAGRPLRERTAEQMRTMLATVTGPTGTGKKASLAGYSVAGKTGTAEKIENGHYVKGKTYASFMGLVPAERPEIGIIVVLDEPKKNSTAGQSAAPFFAKVAESVVRYLNVLPAGAGNTEEQEKNTHAE